MPNMASIVDGANHQPPLKSDIAGERRELLAAFVRELQRMPARWYPILSEGDDGLAVLLGLEYYERYLPLMIKCGLVKCVQGRHYQVPRTSAHFSQKSYSWVAFCTQYKLTDIEGTQSYMQPYIYNNLHSSALAHLIMTQSHSLQWGSTKVEEVRSHIFAVFDAGRASLLENSL